MWLGAPLTLLLLTLGPAAGLDAPVAASSVTPPREPPKPNPLLRGLRSAVLPFVQAPPITRSWVSASFVMALLTSTKMVDPKSICFSEPDVLQKGEWWRLAVNFFFMGDALKSIFFWVQLYHFWECCKMLELVKYRWEPADFIKLIVCNAAMLLVLKQFFPATIFLGGPMVMAFMYMYSREYDQQVMNILGFFSIRCGWLPVGQMLQDLLQAGDISPNLLGLMSGHTYYYFAEVRPRLLLPETPTLQAVLSLLTKGTPLIEPEPEPAAAEAAAEAEAEAEAREAAKSGAEAASAGDVSADAALDGTEREDDDEGVRGDSSI